MKIRRALISVYDKTGIVEFARALNDEFGVEIISTGGTATTLRDAGVPVTLVEDITGCGEMLDGRVKTLHPKIHAAILADRDNPEHMRQLAEAGIAPIDMVVVNLYPFEQTVADPGCTVEQGIEMIDIGGVALLRAAAKNHKHVLLPNHSDDCERVLLWLREDCLSEFGWSSVRRDYASSAFEITSRYDAVIEAWLTENRAGALHFGKWPLRYGENPHQTGFAALLAGGDIDMDPAGMFGPPKKLRALCMAERSPDADVELSYNNFVDADAALGLCAELSRAGAEHELWYRLPACSTVPRASSPSKAIRGESLRRRHLPHIQFPGRTYFITFRTSEIELSEAARDQVLSACRYWHKRKMNLHIACVMPDHVHLLITPFLYSDEAAVPLEEILHSIKSFSANRVNSVMGRSGAVWMQESFDRIMRDEKEFSEAWGYIETNAERADLGSEYRWIWRSDAEFEEGGWVGGVPSKSGLEARSTKNGLEAHTTKGTEDGLEANTTEGPPHCCVFIKHTNACGVGVHASPFEAYRQAYLGDPNAAMGGILAVDFTVDVTFAAAVLETYDRLGRPLREAGAPHPPGGFFVEVWLAPYFTLEAVNLIRGTYDAANAKSEPGEGTLEQPPKKDWGKRVRLLAVGPMEAAPPADEKIYRSISGGLLIQSGDTKGLCEDEWKVVTKRQPSERELADARLAWLICKHTKSNAISVVRDGALLGNGAGQMSRVMSCRIATWLARDNGHADSLAGAVAASDAFFPFPDGPTILMDAGVTMLIQPGGSKRDEEVIAACDARDVAMIFTGTRHFRH